MNVRQSYREAAVRGASSLQLVVRLYEQILEDLRQVELAIEEKDIRWRTDRINHAILVIGHLQSTLDFSQGGEVAKILDEFYNTLRQNLVQVQFFPSQRGIRQQITDVLAVREAWIEVERVENQHVSALTAAPMWASATADFESENPRVDWKG